jgi:hypothetical protein
MNYKSLLFILIIVLASCDKTEPNKVDFDRTALLNNYANNIILPRYQLLQAKSNTLHDAALSFETNINQANLDALRNEFQSTYLSWQACSSAEFGPAEMETLKTVFNTYPVDTSQILNNIASGNYNLEVAQNIDAIGLPALDYLLYGLRANDEDLLNTFSNQTSALGYLLDLTAQLEIKSNTVYNAWKSNYANAFIDANGTDVGSSLALLINEMNMDFERFIRDGKIGIPLGKRSLGNPQIDKLEAYYSKESLALVKASIQNLEDLFNGTSVEGVNGLGLDDYLDAVNATNNGQNLSLVINNQFDAIQVSLNAINGNLNDAIQNNPGQVEEVFNSMQQLVVYMKVDLASNLGVLISYQDNDGD